ncbi:MAG: 16S rRNA (adenine(1518)-N(6)/adenine(1519)-N(6))-dimethyltransferase RsmA [Robiginitalea sp.]|nr:16S rRNA (adenine(1518)-N(6)/adenine(1519)-N(6))-dimethyltransferase RsmA [Robiginitalea sp.]
MSRKGRSRRKGSPAGGREVRPKKHLGQHFLKDTSIARKIADTLTLTQTRNVLEIGPGTGVLTRPLLERPVNIIAVDLDTESVRYLKSNFLPEVSLLDLPYQSLEILEADFLKLDLNPLFGGTPFAITGNFPYNISSQIVFRLLEVRDRVPEFSGMFQKEVAERICAGPGSKTYGILSVLVQAFYEARYCFTVPPEVFDPPPKVASGVLHLARKADYKLECDEALLFRVVKTAFNQRRKTLRNSLKSLQLSDNLKEDAIFDQRPEQLSVPEFISLSKRISDDTL